MNLPNDAMHRGTPAISVFDNWGQHVRNIQFHRHPQDPENTSERINRYQFNAKRQLIQCIDSKLLSLSLTDNAVKPNVIYSSTLKGDIVQTVSVDAGRSLLLRDIAGRPHFAVNAQSVTRTWQYENATSPGRLLHIAEKMGDKTVITERFIWAGNTPAEQGLNLSGQCIGHYDTAGLVQTNSVALSGVPLSVSRHLLKDADTPDTLADWQGDDVSAWNDLLDNEVHTTRTTSDATGAVLTTTDAAGHQQRVMYDVAGQLSGSWLTIKGGIEQIIVKSLIYSAAGQTLHEEQGNGVVTSYTYEPETQRLIGCKTERPAGHASGAKVLQDLHYEYDPVGNVLCIRNDAESPRFWRNQKVVPENTYTYDSLYQLVSATGRETVNVGQQDSGLPSVIAPLPTDSSVCTNYARHYTYDSAGNLTQIRHSAPASNHNYTIDITVSGRSNRGVLSTLTKNPADVDGLFTAGGQQRQLQPGQNLSWTPRGELLEVTPVVRDGNAGDKESYRYNANSQRILKVSKQKTNGGTQTRRVVYLPGLERRTTVNDHVQTESLQVICVGGTGRAQVRVQHWESGKPAAINNDSLCYSYDTLTGSGQLELDGKGDIISQEEYYPYGGTAVWTARSQSEAGYKTIRYSGKERDATGLYYYGYRYYQPWAGRWLCADPAGAVDGLNLFRMVKNNPVSFFDNDGLQPTAHDIERRNRDILRAMRQDEETTDPIAETINNLIQPEETVNITTQQSPLEIPPQAPLRTTARETDTENYTHEHNLPGSGFRRFAMRFLPFQFFSSRLVKKISGQSIRPKIKQGDKYRSTGAFRSKEITPDEASKITEQFASRASALKVEIENGTRKVTDDVAMNINKSISINNYINDHTNDDVSEKTKSVTHFYKLIRSGNSVPYALAEVTYNPDKSLLITHGVVTHPDALLRSEGGEFDVRGVGSSLSILSIIRAFRAHPSANKITTDAVNKFSGNIFQKATRGL